VLAVPSPDQLKCRDTITKRGHNHKERSTLTKRGAQSQREEHNHKERGTITKRGAQSQREEQTKIEQNFADYNCMTFYGERTRKFRSSESG